MSRTPRLLPSGLWSVDLDLAYDDLLSDYEETGKAGMFRSALKKARAYLRKWPAPWYDSRSGLWFVGDEENTLRLRQGAQALGYELIPELGRCACLRFHPFKKGRNLPTCVHQETVRLYRQALAVRDERTSRHAA